MNDVTAIIPSYNSAHLVGRAIESVLEQTSPPNQIIVVDDGSSDDTGAVVKRYGNEVRYLWQPNGGVPVARNRGLHTATTGWVAFLDADDRWLPEKLDRQLALAREKPECGLIYSDATVVDEQGTAVGRFLDDKVSPEGWIFEFLLESFFPLPSTWLLRRETAIQAGGFSEYFRILDDCDFCMRLSRLCPVGFAAEALTLYQRQPNSMSRNHAKADEYEITLMRKLLASGLTPSEQAKVEARLARRLADVAYQRRHTAPKRAIDASLELLRIGPRTVKAWKLCLLATLAYITSDGIA